MEDGSRGGDDLATGDPASPVFSDPTCSLMEISDSTDTMIPKRLFTCVEDYESEAIR